MTQKRARDNTPGQRVFIGIVLALIVVVVGAVVWRNAQKSAEKVSSSAQTVPLLERASQDRPTLGRSSAKVHVVVFESYKCPNCRIFEESYFPTLKSAYIDPGKIRFSFLNLPILGDDAFVAAQAGRCAYKQNPELFWSYSSIIFRAQKDERSTWATPEYLVVIAENVPGLEQEGLRQCLDKQTYRADVEADYALAAQLGFKSTPTVFVNGLKVDFSAGYNVITRAIDTALK